MQSCQLGISGFVGELSSAVTTTVFNFLLLRLAGNVGVAAYGVVANFAPVSYTHLAQMGKACLAHHALGHHTAGQRDLLAAVGLVGQILEFFLQVGRVCVLRELGRCV